MNTVTNSNHDQLDIASASAHQQDLTNTRETVLPPRDGEDRPQGSPGTLSEMSFSPIGMIEAGANPVRFLVQFPVILELKTQNPGSALSEPIAVSVGSPTASPPSPMVPDQSGSVVMRETVAVQAQHSVVEQNQVPEQTAGIGNNLTATTRSSFLNPNDVSVALPTETTDFLVDLNNTESSLSIDIFDLIPDLANLSDGAETADGNYQFVAFIADEPKNVQDKTLKMLAGLLATLYVQYRRDLNDDLGSLKESSLPRQLDEVKATLKARQTEKTELERKGIRLFDFREFNSAVAVVDNAIAGILKKGEQTNDTEDRHKLQVQLLEKLEAKRELYRKAITQLNDPQYLKYLSVLTDLDVLPQRQALLESVIKARKTFMDALQGLMTTDPKTNKTYIDVNKLRNEINPDTLTPEFLQKLSQYGATGKERAPNHAMHLLSSNDILKQGGTFYDKTHDIQASIEVVGNAFLTAVKSGQERVSRHTGQIALLTQSLHAILDMPLPYYIKSGPLQVPEPIFLWIQNAFALVHNTISLWKLNPWTISDLHDGLQALDKSLTDHDLQTLGQSFSEVAKTYLFSSQQGKEALEGLGVGLLFEAGQLTLGRAVMGPLGILMLCNMVGGNLNRLQAILEMERGENTITDFDSEEVRREKDKRHLQRQSEEMKSFFRELLGLATQVGAGIIAAKGVGRVSKWITRDPLLKIMDSKLSAAEKAAKSAEELAQAAEKNKSPEAGKLRELADAAKRQLEQTQQQVELSKKAVEAADKAFNDLMESYRNGTDTAGRRTTAAEAFQVFSQAREALRKALTDNGNMPANRIQLMQQLIDYAKTNPDAVASVVIHMPRRPIQLFWDWIGRILGRIPILRKFIKSNSMSLSDIADLVKTEWARQGLPKEIPAPEVVIAQRVVDSTSGKTVLGYKTTDGTVIPLGKNAGAAYVLSQHLIILDPALLSRPSAKVVGTIMHELVHAEAAPYIAAAKLAGEKAALYDDIYKAIETADRIELTIDPIVVKIDVDPIGSKLMQAVKDAKLDEQPHVVQMGLEFARMLDEARKASDNLETASSKQQFAQFYKEYLLTTDELLARRIQYEVEGLTEGVELIKKIFEAKRTGNQARVDELGDRLVEFDSKNSLLP